MPDDFEITEVRFQFDRIRRETGVTMRTAVQTTLNEVAERVVRATPVRTGRLRGSWFFADLPSVVPSPEGAAIPGEGEVIARVSLDSQRQAERVSEEGGNVFFMNGANYAIFVEARRMFVYNVLQQVRNIEDAVVNTIRNRLALLRGRR